MAWITGPLLQQMRGLKKGQIKARRQRHWSRGVEYAVVDGTTLYNLEAIDARQNAIAASQVNTDIVITAPSKRPGTGARARTGAEKRCGVLR